MDIHLVIRRRWQFCILMSILMFGCQMILRMLTGGLNANPFVALWESVGYAFAYGLGLAFVLKALDWMYGCEEAEDHCHNNK